MRIVWTMVFCTFVLACSSQQEKVRTVLPVPTGAQPAAAAELQKGNALFESRDLAGAEQAFRQAIAMDAAFAEAHYNLALTLDRTGHQEEARKHYMQAANLAPGNKVIWDSPPLRQETGGFNHDIHKKTFLDATPRGF